MSDSEGGSAFQVRGVNVNCFKQLIIFRGNYADMFIFICSKWIC